MRRASRDTAVDPPSRITRVELFELDIPFDDGSAGYDAPTGRWSRFESVLVRITTADGVSGWGECFAYGCRAAVAEAFRTMVAPLLIGQDAEDVPGLMRRVQHALHLFGRYGITIFAVSGADTALWDRRARAAGKPLAALLGAKRRDEVAAYASLVHYGSPPLVQHMARRAVQDGYTSVKLHETTPESIRAGRAGVGPGTHLTVDANCAWSLEEGRSLLPALEEADVGWLEEPLFPPEDFEALADLAAATSVPISAGENACTRYEFRRMMRSGSVTIPQPSVTKNGGVTEFVAVLREAEERGAVCMPHSPYFGPGYWATLQLLAVAPGAPLLEHLYVRPSAFPGVGTPAPQAGRIAIPDTPGIGFEPDWHVLETYSQRSDVEP
jgi:L-alanine-DL-glutamate epimerase-like enolase superfamily enzyme